MPMNQRDLLRLLMNKAGDNPNSLAAKSKVPQSTIYRFLEGDSKEPRGSTFEKLARAYGLPPDTFGSDQARREVAARITGASPAAYVPAPVPATAPDWPFRSVPKKWVTGLSETELQSLDVALFAALKAIVAARPGSDLKLGNVTIVGGLTEVEKSLVETNSFAKKPEKVK